MISPLGGDDWSLPASPGVYFGRSGETGALPESSHSASKPFFGRAEKRPEKQSQYAYTESFTSKQSANCLWLKVTLNRLCLLTR
jgi:hypothetical protein